jgi:chromosome segregation ATPase
MAKKQDPENQDDPKLDDDGNPIEEPEEEGTEDPNQQSADDEPPDETDQDDDDDRDWQASYKGLQKVVSRKEKAAESLKKKYDKLSEQHESQKAKSGAADTAQSDLEKQLKEAKTELDTLTSERDKLNNQLSQTNLVMEKFPEIAPLAQYIPTADTIEDFEKNAKKFAEDVGAQIETGVDKKLEGASPGAPPGEEGLDTENEKDKLWDELNELGRDPEKNAEYEAKFKEWEALFDND